MLRAESFVRTLYDPGAGQAAPMTRERLRILFIGVLRSRDWSQLVVAEADDGGRVVDLSDEMRLASSLYPRPRSLRLAWNRNPTA